MTLTANAMTLAAILFVIALGLWAASTKTNAALVFSDPRWPGLTATVTPDEKNPGKASLLLENFTVGQTYKVADGGALNRPTVPGALYFELDQRSSNHGNPVWQLRPGTGWIKPGSSAMYHLSYDPEMDPSLLEFTGDVDGPSNKYTGRFELACIPEPGSPALGLIGSCLLLFRRRQAYA